MGGADSEEDKSNSSRRHLAYDEKWYREEFGINNNKLCNYILEKLKYKKEIDVEKDLESQGRPVKKIIQSLTLMFPTKRYIMMCFVIME